MLFHTVPRQNCEIKGLHTSAQNLQIRLINQDSGGETTSLSLQVCVIYEAKSRFLGKVVVSGASGSFFNDICQR